MKWTDEKRAVIAMFAVALGALLLVGVLSYRTTTDLIKAAASRHQANLVLDKLQSLLSELRGAESSQRAYLITGAESELESYRAAVSKIHRTLKDLRDLTEAHPRQKQNLAALEPTIVNNLTELQQTIDLRKEKGFGPAREAVLAGKGKQPAEEIQKVIADSAMREDELVSRRDEEMKANARNSLIMQFVGTSLGCVLLVAVFIMLSREISRRTQAENELRALARQQAAIAGLGQVALAGVDLNQLMDEAVSVVARTLGVEYCKILELLPDGRALLVRAGLGWKEGTVGHAMVGTDAGSQAGYTLLSHEPVAVEDLRTETRFHGPPLLVEHNVVSGLSVIIPGSQRPFGILGAHTSRRRVFNKDDVNFLQAIAHTLAAAIERKRAEEMLRQQAQVLAQIHDSVVSTDLEGIVKSWNQGAVRLSGYSPEEALGQHISFMYPADQQEFLSQEVIEPLKAKGVHEIEVRMQKKSGVKFYAHLSLSLLRDNQGSVIGMIGYSMDITERKVAEQISAGQTQALLHTLNVLTTEPDLGRLLGDVLVAVAKEFNAHSCALWLYDPAKKTLELRQTAYGGRVYTDDQQLDHPNASGPVWVMQDSLRESLPGIREPFVFMDAAHSPPLEPEVCAWAAAEGLKSILCVPLLFGNKPIGLLTIHDAKRKDFAPQEKDLARALAPQVTLAVQLTHLAAQGEQSAVLQERNRMAQEIHDTLAQGLAGIVLQLEAAEDVLGEGAEEARAHVSRARTLARESLGEARRSVWALRPQALESGDLATALRHFAGQLTTGTPILVEFSQRGTPCRLSPEAEFHLLRIGQEALTNAVNHAEASKIRVELVHDAQGVQLSVQDDGRGFGPRQQSSNRGFGIISMNERAERVGAQLTIFSEPGLGTRVVAMLPTRADGSGGVPR